MNWQVIQRGSEMHVMPINDLRPHSPWPDCWCGCGKDDNVWVHHALDRREDYEWVERPLNEV
jgi:hypothetical protein